MSPRIETDEGKNVAGGGRLLGLRLLGALAGLLVLVILAGTVYGLATGTRQRKLALEAADRPPLSGEAVFAGIGTLRAATADAKKAIVVATIAFPYDASQRPFGEELLRKAPVLKAAATAYFSRKTAADLAPAYEGAVKAALRDAFNALLSLGKVGEIWLSDFAVIQ
jgi:flagellar basal body-associated protein FliL